MIRMMRGVIAPIPGNSYVCFRAVIPQKTQLSIYAKDFYELWNNGTPVSYGPVKSGEPLLYYDRFQLSDSQNVVVVKVHGRRQPPELWCETAGVEVPWRAKLYTGYDENSPNTIGDVGFSEYFNLDSDETRWVRPDYDDSDWPLAAAGGEIDELHLRPRPIPHQYEKKLIPLELKWNAGELLADFGMMIYGRLELEGRKCSGSQLNIEYIEDLERGWARVENRRAMYADRLSGKCEEFHWKSFAKRGFRYVVISGGLEECVALQAWEYGYPLSGSESFRCSDPELNRLWEISARTLRTCMDDIYNDCPHRDQAQWMDAFVSSRIALSLYGVTDLTRKCILQHGVCSFKDGKLLSPSICGWNFMPDYAMIQILFIRWYYQVTGDRELIAEIWHNCVAGVDYMKHYRQPDGLLADVNVAYLDNAFELCRQEKCAALNSLYYAALNAMADLASILEKGGDAAQYRREAACVAGAFHCCFDLPGDVGTLRDSSARPERSLFNYNFSCEFGGKYRGRTARVEFEIFWPETGPKELLFGAFGPCRVFCNGNLCGNDSREADWCRPLPAFAPNRVELALQQGINTIVLEADCNFLNWDLYFDADGIDWGTGRITEVDVDGQVISGPIFRKPRFWKPPVLSQTTHGYAAFSGLIGREALQKTLPETYYRNYVSVRVPLFSVETTDPEKLAAWVLPPNTPWTMFFFLSGLFENGLENEAMKLLRRAWGVMLDRNAQNTWEEWNWNSSLCHAWGASPCYFFHREILGVKHETLLEPELLVRPDLFDLVFARGRVMLNQNEWIDLRLERQAEQTLLTLSAHTRKKVHIDSSRLPKPVRISMTMIDC